MKCTRCRGTGDVMTRDTGVCGAEEWGTCGLCLGTGTLPPELETLHNQVDQLKRRVSELE